MVWVKSGQDALNAINTQGNEISVMILDLMLPDLGGLEVLERTRLQGRTLPILILSAKHLEREKVKALELGADDYVTKPFGLMELLARVKGLHKRYGNTGTSGHKNMSLGQSQLETQTLMATSANGNLVRLSPIEAELFICFAQNPNTILSREHLLDEVWKCGSRIETRTVDVFVGKLRKIIETNPQKPEVLVSVRGAGYMHKKILKNRQDTSF